MDGEGSGRVPADRLGALLREYRLAAGLSQEELAHRCGLSARSVSNIERGQTTRPFVRSVRVLADALALDRPARELLFQVTYCRPAPTQPAEADQVAGANEGAPGGSVVAEQEPRVVPRQLPSPGYRFVGRRAELRRLFALANQVSLGDTGQIVVISGMPGVGKTALALHWARRAQTWFPGGQIYLSLGGFAPGPRQARLAEPVRELLDGLGIQQDSVPAGPAAQAALYRSLLHHRRVLVLLDDALSAAQVRPLLPGSPGSLVLVTSRKVLTSLNATEGALLMRLGLLSYAEAWRLLEGRAGRPAMDSGQQAVRTIIRLCAGLPLALSLAAARAETIPGSRAAAVAAVAAELGHGSGGLSVFDVLDCGEPAADLRAVFGTSYRSLSPAAAAIFRLLGRYPGPVISAPATASMAGLPLRETRSALTELAQANLLAEHPAGHYRLHDLLRAYAAETSRAEGPQARSRNGQASQPLSGTHAAYHDAEQLVAGEIADLP